MDGTLVATVLTVYGIETLVGGATMYVATPESVATVLTVYGIETHKYVAPIQKLNTMLQQCLPFTVLKQYKSCIFFADYSSCNSAYRLRY